MVRQVPVLGTLTMVYGGLQLFLAVLVACASPVGFLEEGDVGLLFFGFFLAVVYGVVGIAHLVAGHLCRQFRARVVVIAVLCAGILSCPFCGVLSFALPIYGLVVLLQADVAHAFMMGGEDWEE
jgi:hypothetical protein